MLKEKIKLTGQLIEDKYPVILAIEDNLLKIKPIVEEYQDTFPGIFLTCEWGYFKKPISQEKARALANLFKTINSPLQSLLASVQQSNINKKIYDSERNS